MKQYSKMSLIELKEEETRVRGLYVEYDEQEIEGTITYDEYNELIAPLHSKIKDLKVFIESRESE